MPEIEEVDYLNDPLLVTPHEKPKSRLHAAR